MSRRRVPRLGQPAENRCAGECGRCGRCGEVKPTLSMLSVVQSWARVGNSTVGRLKTWEGVGSVLVLGLDAGILVAMGHIRYLGRKLGNL